MGDGIDDAQAYDEFFLSVALKNQGLGIAGEGLNQPPTSSPQPLHCEDCGEEIPEARRRAQPGCRRCIRCQTELEQTLTHWRPL